VQIRSKHVATIIQGKTELSPILRSSDTQLKWQGGL